MSAVQEIEPKALKSLIDEKKNVLLIDVRQPEEFEIVNLPGSNLIPLDQLPSRLEEVKKLVSEGYDECIVYCRGGARSESAIEWLSENGVQGLLNLRGGINAYATEADSSLPTY